MSVQISGDTYTIELELPQGAPFDEIALYADGAPLVAGASTRVIGAVTGSGTLVAMHQPSETLIAGAQTVVGNVWSKGGIRVSTGAHVNGVARAAGTITLETGGTADQTQGNLDFPNASTPFSLVVEFTATGPADDRTATTGTLLVLEPAAYRNVVVPADASLELTSGTYHLDSLDVDALGRLRVRANHGPVELRVRNMLDLAGALDIVAGSASQFRLVYLGGDPDLTLTAPFFATVLAPGATLTLAPGPGATDEFVGAYLAAGITTQNGVVVRQQAFFAAPTPLVARYFYGLMGPVGAGPYERTLPVPTERTELHFGGGPLPELHEDKLDGDGQPTDAITVGLSDTTPAVRDSRTYTLVIEAGSASERIETVVLQAAEGTRPFVTITGDGGGAANLTPAARTSSTEPRRFELDGVWFGTSDDAGNVRSRDFVIAPGSTAPGVTDWDEIVIRHATLDPGGLRADRTRIAAIKLNVTGKVKKLLIERSIVGPIEVTGDGLVEEIEIEDSIVDATQLALDANGRRVAIRSGNGVVRLTGVTVLGDIEADVLEASDSIVTGQLVVADTQQSCFRFSAASAGPPATPELPKRERLPRLFQSTIVPGGIEATVFTSQRFGDPGYGQIAELVPDFIATGAENGSELGAFSFLLAPVRLASVLAKVDEFKPIGVIAQYIVEGEAAL